MPSRAERAIQPFIILFCLFHMAAVLIVAIPMEARDAVSQWTRINLLPLVQPYTLITSQWQQWKLFSPDPARRIVAYDIDAQLGNSGWQQIATFDPRNPFRIFRRASQFKLLGRLLETRVMHLPLTERFLQVMCQQHRLPTGTVLRLTYHVAELPDPAPLDPANWQRVRLREKEIPGTSVFCGRPPSTATFRLFTP